MTEHRERRTRKRSVPPVVKYFGYIMVLVYFVLGAIILFTDEILPGMPQMQRNLLGGLLLLYGLFRAYTTYANSKKRERDRL